MICAICLAEGRPLIFGPLDLSLIHPTPEPDPRPAGAAITIRGGVALCLDHYRQDPA